MSPDGISHSNKSPVLNDYGYGHVRGHDHVLAPCLGQSHLVTHADVPRSTYTEPLCSDRHWLAIWNTGPLSRQWNKRRVQETVQRLAHRLDAMQDMIPKNGICNCRSAIQLVNCVANDRLLKYKRQHFFSTDERRLSSKSLTRQCS